MKYDVHIYASVRVKVYGVEAATQAEAIEKACSLADGDFLGMFPDCTPEEENSVPDGTVASGGYAEDITGFLVDQCGDEEYEHSRSYGYDGQGKLREHQPQPTKGVDDVAAV